MEIFYWLRSQLLFDVIREHQTLREGGIYNYCIFTSSARLDTPAHINPKDQVYLSTVNKVRSSGILTEPEWAPPETTFFGHGNRRGILMMSLCPPRFHQPHRTAPSHRPTSNNLSSDITFHKSTYLYVL